MNIFLDFAKRHFAEKLGIPAEEVEKWYEFVNKNFFITITNSKFVSPNAPETFSACLQYHNAEDDYSASENLIGFKSESGQSEFKTPEEALDIALRKVNNVEFTRKIHFVVFCDIPYNALIMFDTEREKERVMKEIAYDKQLKSDKNGQAF